MPFADGARSFLANLSLGTTAAPSVDIGHGVPTSYSSIRTDAANFVGRFNFTNGGNVGLRKEFSTPLDFTIRKYLATKLELRTFNVDTLMETVDNGGCVLVFQDSSGRYAGFSVFGSDVRSRFPYIAFSENPVEGYPSGFNGWTSVRGNTVIIDRTATPDYQSLVASVDWSDIVGIEMQVRATSTTSNRDLGFEDVLGIDDLVYTGTVPALPELADEFSSSSLFAYSTTDTNTSTTLLFLDTTPTKFASAFLSGILIKTGFQFGDGTAETTFIEKNSFFAIESLWEDRGSFTVSGRHIITDGTRFLDFNCSPTDVFQFSNCAFSSSTKVSIRVLGNSGASVSFTGVNFFGLESVELAHASAVNCRFEKLTDNIKVTSDSVMTNSTVVDTGGVFLESAAGDYSHLEINFTDGNFPYDLIVGEGGAGTYDFSGITVDSGYTLKVHNSNPAAPVTVRLPPGTPHVTSTEGGSVAIDDAVVADLVLTGLKDGTEVRVIRASDLTELTGSESVNGGIFTYSYTHSGIDEVVDIVVHALSYVSLRLNGIALGTTGASIPVQQRADLQYGNP